MRALTATLTAAQRSANRIPAVKVTASNRLAGVVNARPVRLYSGAEDDGPHGVAICGDGSMVRVRVTSPDDNRKLYRQRVAAPGPDADFSLWEYMGVWGVEACAVCAHEAEVSVFWIDNGGVVNTQVSADNGATWRLTEWPGFAPASDTRQMAAVYKPNGDLDLFFADLNTVYHIQRLSGEWQSREAWDKTTGELTGIAAVYDGDIELLVSGKDISGNPKIWSLVYEEAVETGSWSEPKEIAAAPAGSDYEYSNLFLAKAESLPGEDHGTGVFRCFYTERFTGTVGYERPYWSHTLPGTAFADGRWREPTPFETESAHGIAIAHSGNNLWLEMPSGVWLGSLAEITAEMGQDVLSIKEDLAADSGKITIELSNGRGKYVAPGTGNLAAMQPGCRVSFSPGYRTPAGDEFSAGQHFIIQNYEWQNAPGKNSLFLNAADGWSLVEEWTARFQFRWNRPDEFGAPTSQACVKEIMAQVLARAGLRLEIVSESAVATGFYPDFTIHPGEDGRTVIAKLLSFIPDRLLIEGDSAYMVNPLASDAATYSYGSEHAIFEGRYRNGLLSPNRVVAGGELVSAESCAWDDIQSRGEIMQTVNDLNLVTESEALDRGAALIRQAEIASGGGYVRAPVNCGQQLWDVISVTDAKAGLAGARRRVLGISLTYLPAKAEYEQKIVLGGV